MPLNFEDQQIQRPRYEKETNRPSWLKRFVMRIGLAKTEERANQVLLLLAICLFLISLIIFFVYMKKNTSEQKVTYKFSKDLIKKLPQNIQIKLPQ